MLLLAQDRDMYGRRATTRADTGFRAVGIMLATAAIGMVTACTATTETAIGIMIAAGTAIVIGTGIAIGIGTGITTVAGIATETGTGITIAGKFQNN